MPKRSAAYKSEQRAMIARAALECILDTGFAATSMRAVAVRAGVSTGAVYVHFDSREDLIAAAALSEPFFPFTPVDNWEDYARLLDSSIGQVDANERFRNLTRAMYEFTAELDLSGKTTPLLDRHIKNIYRFLQESLTAMHQRGEITLPLGLDTTLQVHLQLLSGATYSLFANPLANTAQIRGAFLAGLHKTAGCKAMSNDNE